MNNQEQLKSYKCSNCKINILSNNEINKCVYCNNNLKEQFYYENNISYDYIIPFKKTKEDAINILKKYINHKKLRPKEFNINKNLNNIYDVYIPIWVFDYEAAGEVDFNCKKISKFKSKNRKYTKTDSYLVTLGGSMRFKNIISHTTQIIDEDTFNKLNNFNYNNLQEFNNFNLPINLLEEQNLKIKDIINLSETKVKNMFIDKMKQEIKDYNEKIESENSINLNNIKKQCILLPLFLFTTNYKGKIYSIIINGQTGKIVGEIPISYKKLIFKWLLFFIIVFVLLYLLFNYKVIL